MKVRLRPHDALAGDGAAAVDVHHQLAGERRRIERPGGPLKVSGHAWAALGRDRHLAPSQTGTGGDGGQQRTGRLLERLRRTEQAVVALRRGVEQGGVDLKRLFRGDDRAGERERVDVGGSRRSS